MTVRSTQSASQQKNSALTKLNGLAELFRGYPDIQAVYLFGSVPGGRTHAESDLDLAIVPRASTARARKLDILTALAKQGFDNVDLVFLDTDDIVLKYEAIRQNCLIYAAPDFERGAMYSNVVRMYLDFLPYLEVQRNAYKERILSGQG